MAPDRRVVDLLKQPQSPSDPFLERKQPCWDVRNGASIRNSLQHPVLRMKPEAASKVLQSSSLATIDPRGVLSVLILSSQIVDAFIAVVFAHLGGLEAIPEANHLR